MFNLRSLFLAFIFLNSPAYASGDVKDEPPVGAKILGYFNKVIDFYPTVEDIAPNGTADGYKLYDGMFYHKKAANRWKYTFKNGALVIPNNSMLVTQKRTSKAGQLPYLSGEKGFYVEANFSLNSNDPQVFSAFWLMPWEHNLAQTDHYPGDPPGYERWMELDVDEGKFSAGTTSSVISWEGVFDIKTRRYYRDHPTNRIPGSTITNFRSKVALDRTKRHVFGASYDPLSGGIVTWYLDGKKIAQSGKGAAPEVAKLQNFYMIIGNQYEGDFPKYELYLYRLSAWTP